MTNFIKCGWSANYKVLFFQIPDNILAHPLVFRSSKGLPGISKIRKNITWFRSENASRYKIIKQNMPTAQGIDVSV